MLPRTYSCFPENTPRTRTSHSHRRPHATRSCFATLLAHNGGSLSSFLSSLLFSSPFFLFFFTFHFGRERREKERLSARTGKREERKTQKYEERERGRTGAAGRRRVQNWNGSHVFHRRWRCTWSCQSNVECKSRKRKEGFPPSSSSSSSSQSLWVGGVTR